MQETKVLKVVEVREKKKTVYIDKDIDRLETFLKLELINIDADYLIKTADSVGISPARLFKLLRMDNKTGRRQVGEIITEKKPLTQQEKIILYFFGCLYEARPVLKNVLNERLRSYWLGYSEAGGNIPDDISAMIMFDGEYSDLKYPINTESYRQGVRDYTEERTSDE